MVTDQRPDSGMDRDRRRFLTLVRDVPDGTSTTGTTLRPGAGGHDGTCRGAVGGRQRGAIDDLRDETYSAKGVVRREGEEEVLVDSRPSDAITLALKAQVPIYVAERVMNAAAAG